jgi:hypothetical protein
MGNVRFSGLMAVALSVIACGQPSVTALKVEPNACAFAQRTTCQMGLVPVETELPAGTELSRPECDALCLPVNCAGEAKKCTVQLAADSLGQVVLCEPMGC